MDDTVRELQILLEGTEPPLEALSLVGFKFNYWGDDAKSLRTLHLLTPALRHLRLDLDVAGEALTENRTNERQLVSLWTDLRVIEAFYIPEYPILFSFMPF